MELRWTKEAADDLERIADYLFEHAPDRAAAIVLQIYNAPSELLIFPHRGRPGKKGRTRELVLSPLPYIVGLSNRRQRHSRCPHPARSTEVAVTRGASVGFQQLA